jgi:FMN phosphatase YigB (HAD superfamily)
MNAYIKNFFLLLTSISPIAAQAVITTSTNSTRKTPEKIIILDINDVVARASRMTIAKQSISWSLLRYLCWNFATPKKATFDFLIQEFGEQQPLNPLEAQDQWRFVVGDGDSKLPQIMVDHKAGRLTSQEVLDKTRERIKNPTKYTFSKETEKQAVQELIEVIFHPTLIVENTYPLDEAITLFKDCVEQSGAEIMILSNFPKDTFKVFYQQPMTQEWLKTLHVKPENIMISGELGFTKPDVKIYDYALSKLEKMNPKFKDKEYLHKNVIFIDDKECNIKGAQAAGLTGLVCDGNYAMMRKKLQKQGFLRPRSKL